MFIKEGKIVKFIKKVIIIILIFNFLFNVTSIANIEELEFEDEIIQTVKNYIQVDESELKINAPAAICFDRTSKKVVYEKNAYDKRAMASTTKIMTAIVAVENGNLKDIVKISNKAAWTGGSRLGLKTGDEVTLENLLYGLMLCSR